MKYAKRVTEDRWRDAVNFLMGLGVANLTAADQLVLREGLRGPFAKGMTAVEAERYLTHGLGWERGGDG